MTPEQRALTFWLVCIPVRSSLACVARALTSRTTGTTHPALRALATVPAYRWMRGLEVGNEGVLGGPVWWADTRQVHGALYAAFSVSGRWEWLCADAVLGAVHWGLAIPEGKRLAEA